MALFERAAAGFASLETKAADISALTWAELTGGPAKSGVSVNVDSALRTTAVLACARVLANGIAQIPLRVGEEDARGSFKVALDNPLHKLLYRKPNDWMTSSSLRRTLMLHLGLTQNAYCFKNTIGGVVRELLPLVPGCVTVLQDPDFELRYVVADPNGGIIGEFRKQDILHIRGLSWNGYLGMETVRLAREAIGLSIATEETHARLHANGARPGGILTVPERLSDEARARLKNAFSTHQEGLANAFRTLVLDANMKWDPMAMKGVDNQHIETRRFQIEEVCRAMGVLPLMIGHFVQSTTFASAEQMFLAHVMHGLMPWIEEWQQTLDLQLGLMDVGLSARFNVRGLLRGDAKSMAEYYASGILNGWLTRNEARLEEGLDWIEGLDKPLVPLNMGTQDQLDATTKAIAHEVRSMLGHNGGPAMDAELELKIGRVLSSRNEKRLVTARDEIDQVLASLKPAA